jgi:predicted nucleic acid-binding protein
VSRIAIDPETLVRLAGSSHEISTVHQLLAPNSIRSLALDILLQRVRNRELSEREAMTLHERMTELKIRLLGDRVSRRTAWQIALENDLNTVGLAEYVAVATLQADALLTFNPELAAIALGHVPLAKMTDLFER